MRIVFETHSTSLDNEAGLASGHDDVDLSKAGERQAGELGRRRRDDGIEMIYTSDLRRAWRTAEIALGASGIRIVRDARLRECDYGSLSRAPVARVAALREQAVLVPFPGGESYAQVTERVASWLDEVQRRPERHVLVIGHRATHYALEHLLADITLVDAVSRPFEWQPGWVYDVR